MSLQRLGVNPDGSRHIVYGEPGRARLTGGGGAALMHPFTISPLQPFKRKHEKPPTKRPRTHPVCGAPLPRLADFCGRRAGHVHPHRSVRAVELDNARRRRIYARGEA